MHLESVVYFPLLMNASSPSPHVPFSLPSQGIYSSTHPHSSTTSSATSSYDESSPYHACSSYGRWYYRQIVTALMKLSELTLTLLDMANQ